MKMMKMMMMKMKNQDPHRPNTHASPTNQSANHPGREFFHFFKYLIQN